MMNKQEIIKEFEANGFTKEKGDPEFLYRKELITQEEAIENNLVDDEIPCLLFGDNGTNSGFCIYTGDHFVWLNCQTPEEAVKISETIVAFEPV